MRRLLLGTLSTCLAFAAPAMANPNLIADGAEVEKMPGEYLFTEGPATDADGNVFFTDQPNNRIVKWNAGNNSVEDWLKPAGRSNGMAFDGTGNLLTCADAENQLWSIAPDKTVTVLVDNLGEKLLNGPNDLWIHPGGSLFFTDPLYKRPYWKRDAGSQMEGNHVYFMKSQDAQPLAVEKGLKQPNGIIGTPDGKLLYVADIGDKKTYAYEIAADGSLRNRRVFCESGSDGMTLDEKGNLYLTGKGVTVFSPAGEEIAQIDIPEPWTANVTFGGKDRKLLFITASKGIYGLRMKVAGVR